MEQIDLSGLHKIKQRLATGKVKTYYYTKRGKGGKRILSEFGSRAFLREFLELTNEPTPSPRVSGTYTVSDLVADYLGSPEFSDRRPSTQRDYKRYLKIIDAKFGRVPIEVMDQKETRIAVRRWRDSMVDKPRAADMAHAVLKLLLSFGMAQGKLDHNILNYRLVPLRKARDSNRADKIWMPEDIESFKATAPEHLVRVLVLALNTAQRKGDLLAMRWDQYDGKSIKLIQSKTGALVYIAASAELRDMLDNTPMTCARILANKSGAAWGGGFDSSWRKAAKKAGVSGLTFHDLRGTAVAIAMAAGATDQEIAAMTGHSQAHLETLRIRYMPSFAVIRKMDAYKSK